MKKRDLHTKSVRLTEETHRWLSEIAFDRASSVAVVAELYIAIGRESTEKQAEAAGFKRIKKAGAKHG